MTARLFYSERYAADIGPHVFPMQKFALIREDLLASGTATAADFAAPRPATRDELARVHSAAYLDKLATLALSPAEIRTLELPLSRGLVEASILCAGGSILACRRALVCGFAANLAGGFHHAFPDHGEGFCVLNDVAVGVRAMLAEGRVQRVAVVDVDVHHGNGTAAIFAGEPRVFTGSIHQEPLYPLVKPPGDLDIGLDIGTGGDVYLAALDDLLAAALAGHPGLVYYVAGADPYEHDQLGGLALTRDDLAERDRRVLGACAARAIPAVMVPAGGYALAVADTVAIHVTTIAIGLELWPAIGAPAGEERR